MTSITGYELVKAFYVELQASEAMQIKAKPQHQSLYTWICELRNRTGREILDLPVRYTMQMSLIGSEHTLAKAIKDLADWGIIEVLVQTKGVGTKVKLSVAFMQKHCKSTANDVQMESKSDANAVQTIKTSKTNETGKKDIGAGDSKTEVDMLVRYDGNGRMIRPTIEALKAYVESHGGTSHMAQAIFNFYGSKGWKVGKEPMSNWHLAASGWISRENQSNGSGPSQATKKMVY